ncbi:hypothetical protein [Nitrobacter hamburgensis]|nr:hypothetical protein [Nitrobacter hamburgensis]
MSVAVACLGAHHHVRMTSTRIVMKTLHKPEQPEDLRPWNPQRANIIPTEGFAMVVDGRLKANFVDEEAARAAGAELLARFPMLRVEVYNAETRVRTKVEALATG